MGQLAVELKVCVGGEKTELFLIVNLSCAYCFFFCLFGFLSINSATWQSAMVAMLPFHPTSRFSMCSHWASFKSTLAGEKYLCVLCMCMWVNEFYARAQNNPTEPKKN